jgi:ectoine hydroxylase-related dioxygenase (phytanoyl-CoA dioxygenase family)
VSGGLTVRAMTHAGVSPLDRLRSHGYMIFESLVSEALIDQVCEELAPWFAATPRCRGDFYGRNTTRFGAVLLKSAAAHELLMHPEVRFLVGQVLDAHCDWHQLNLSQAVRIHPGERRQIPHRDDEMWPGVKGGVEYLVNVMWALSDFTRENGATLIWPRSQFAAPSRSVSPDAAVVATMPRGSALLYLGSVAHSGGGNTTNLPRTGLIFSYCLGWLKQYENAFLTYPPHVAAGFSKEVRDLLGYRIHRPNLGGYEGQDPAVLFETNSHTLAATDCLGDEAAAQLRAFREAFP